MYPRLVPRDRECDRRVQQDVKVVRIVRLLKVIDIENDILADPLLAPTLYWSRLPGLSGVTETSPRIPSARPLPPVELESTRFSLYGVSKFRV